MNKRKILHKKFRLKNHPYKKFDITNHAQIFAVQPINDIEHYFSNT